METLVCVRRYKDDGHFHDASEHGMAWAALNELLHVIVFVFKLYGMVQFRVKFIRMINSVKWISRLIIAHNFYLSTKFAIIATLMYLYNLNLEQQSIEWSTLNCSLDNYARVLKEGASGYQLGSFPQAPQMWFHTNYLSYMTDTLNALGGPYKVLGNRATLVYGVYSIAAYIMVAIFPLELMYFIDVGFNFIRFVLSDPGCMEDLYEKRKRHLARLSSWSRNQADSRLTQGAKMILSQRELRSNYTHDYNQLTGHLFKGPCSLNHLPMVSHTEFSLDQFPEYLIEDGEPMSSTAVNQNHHHQQAPASTNKDPTKCRHHTLAQVAQLQRKLSTNVKQLRTRLAINHLDRPSYQVSIANRNLERFKPFVRSDVWFKASMIIYPIFIFFYFMTLLIVLGLIEYYFECYLDEVIQACKQRHQPEPTNTTTTTTTTATTDWMNWPWWDKLIYYENIYTVFLLSCASSFYCSYYFGTILELSIWMKEIKQQLALSTHVIELTDVLTHSSQFSPMQVHQLLSTNSSWHSTSEQMSCYVNDFGGLNELFPSMKSKRTLELLTRKLKQLIADILLFRVWKLKSALGACLTPNERRGQMRLQLQELMAIRLLTKKQTLLRATYVNMCLFFDELHETRFMTTTILRRTTQIASGFAFMASITRSQFKANYWYLNYLLVATLVVFNLYLACAAFINSCVNKMLVQIHSLISASLRTGSEDTDLFEFWLRHVGSLGEEKDVMAYRIYGYKVTWSTIINIDSVIFTVYFMTT